MSHTVIGIFESTNQAQEAKSKLVTEGVSNGNVDINTSGSAAGQSSSDVEEGTGDRISKFFSSIFNDSDETTSNHIEAGRKGVVVTVHAQTEQQALRAVEIMDDCGAVDVNEFAQKAKTDTDKIQVIEEELQVGKREVETGGVRLRSRIVERPVEESIRLREEHVTVERTPVNRAATEADFNEGSLAMTETAERAVVAKEAHVVEEVSLAKEVSENEQTISDTVRHTEVDTENLPGNERS